MRNVARKTRVYAPVFAALGDETRLAIVARLADGARHSISELTTGSKISRQGLSKHLRVLESAGVVKNTRDGRESLFELLPEPLDEAQAYLHEVSEQWGQALLRLKAFVETDC
jgi:DNA-binding transcriptional ArsR family regulator